MPHHAFISYVREDTADVTRLAEALATHQLSVWLDRENLVPGQRWRDAVRDAIRAGDLFLACFSRSDLAREKSYMNEELTLAIEELRQRPANRSWFIPITLDGSAIPQRSIGGGETLHDLQWVDLSAEWGRGVEMIVRAAGKPPRAPEAPAAPSPASSLVEKAVRISTRKTMQQSWDRFIWSLEGVSAALDELKLLYATTTDLVNNLNGRAPALQLEVETAMPSCAVRYDNRTLMFSWLQPSANTVSDATLYILDYDFRYYLSGPNRRVEPPVVGRYQFAHDGESYGWSSESRTFITTKRLAEWLVDRVLSSAA